MFTFRAGGAKRKQEFRISVYFDFSAGGTPGEPAIVNMLAEALPSGTVRTGQGCSGFEQDGSLGIGLQILQAAN